MHEWVVDVSKNPSCLALSAERSALPQCATSTVTYDESPLLKPPERICVVSTQLGAAALSVPHSCMV